MHDLFIIGGGVNGVGIARDAAGRGHKVCLAEMGDLGGATSSASTKLFHGGLRYLEFFEFGLVKKALVERAVLLKMMPHISWPMRFVLPYSPEMRFEGDTPTSRLLTTFMPWMKGRRPAWLIRLGLLMYDRMGGKGPFPPTKSLDLSTDPAGAPLKKSFEKAFEYSDAWVEDSRLVVLNARDAEAHGAEILTRCKVLSAEREGDHWLIRTEAGERCARAIVNAAGPWVSQVITGTLRRNTGEGIRLVRGSHLVTKKLFDHDKCYFFQGTDGRIIFAIPYETDFTLIGTTDAEHANADEKPKITPEERQYLLDFASQYFERPVTDDDVVHAYSGVRPLYDDGVKSATAATRDYVLTFEDAPGAPLLNVFGGKITTYRTLSQKAVNMVGHRLGNPGREWTAGAHLPGGDFAVGGAQGLAADLVRDFPFLTERWALRLVRAYGTEAREILGDAKEAGDLGRDFGATLTEAELRWLMEREYARTAEDVVWRRSKLGLRLDSAQISALDDWMSGRLEAAE